MGREVADDTAWREKPWTQHPGESPHAFEAFVHWLDGIPTPTMAQVARRSGHAPDTVKGWASGVARRLATPLPWAARRAALVRYRTRLIEAERDALALVAVRVRQEAHAAMLEAVPNAVALLASFVKRPELEGEEMPKPTPAQLKAIQDILDRAGIGQLDVDALARDATRRAEEQAPPTLSMASLPQALRGPFLALIAVATGQRSWSSADAEALCYAADSLDAPAPTPEDTP